MDEGNLSFVNFSIILNRRPRGKIVVRRGLRQGAPLSPFLFTVIGDSSSRLINCALRRILNGIVAGKGRVDDHTCSIH